jgi:hypothetical protein
MSHARQSSLSDNHVCDCESACLCTAAALPGCGPPSHGRGDQLAVGSLKPWHSVGRAGAVTVVLPGRGPGSLQVVSVTVTANACAGTMDLGVPLLPRAGSRSESESGAAKVDIIMA